MKRIVALTAVFLLVGLAVVEYSTGSGLPGVEPVLAQDEIKMPETIILGKDSKLGQVKFNHVSHNGGAYKIDGTGPIACKECHHTAQPASELAKLGLKTPWPADRTTTLTAELFAKDPKAAGVAACRDCHAPAGGVPKLMAKIPEMKHESSTAIISLTNQQAFHRNCAGCHTEVAKQNKAQKGPTTMQCTACHKRGG